MNVTQIPSACVTASFVRITPLTTQGCRPTSVTIHPHSSATIADSPDTATARRNHFVCGMSRRRHHTNPNHSPRPISIEQTPTMMSKDQCSIVFAGGRSLGGTESSPVTFVLVLQPTRNESRPGMPMPPLTPLDVQRPKRYSVTSVDVFCTHSIA